MVNAEVFIPLEAASFTLPQDKKIAVIIPAYNEERFIGSVILKLRRYPFHIIVVDDGSTDTTADIAARAGAEVLKMETNQGKAAALNRGFAAARGINPDAVVVIDGDGQHLTRELPAVLTPILEGKADFVIGSRYIRTASAPPSAVPPARVAGHRFFNWLTAAASGVGVSDSQSGYRAFSPRALPFCVFQSAGFTVESEMQFIAAQNHLTVAEVPITIRYLDKPKRSVIDQGLRVLNGILRLTSQYRPLLFFGGPGTLFSLVGIAFGILVVVRYQQVGVLAVGYTLVSVLTFLTGVVLVTSGLILNSIQATLHTFMGDLAARFGTNRK